jgi:hypothetical protein
MQLFLELEFNLSVSAYPIAISKIFRDPFNSRFNAHFSLNIAHAARDGAQQAATQTRGTVYVVEFSLTQCVLHVFKTEILFRGATLTLQQRCVRNNVSRSRVTGHLQQAKNITQCPSVKITVVTFRIIRARRFYSVLHYHFWK